MHGGQAFRENNEAGDIILDFALLFDIVIANTFCKKTGAFNTYKSGTSMSWIDFFINQIDFFLVLLACKDYNVIPGEF